MKRKKMFAALLCASAVFAGAGMLAACGEETPPAGGGHTHEWQWQSDETQHWQQCKDDTAEKEGSRGAHADADKDGKCDDCGRPMEVTPEHTHDWKWQSDETQHWQQCKDDTTEKPGSRGAHTDADKDGECDECGYPMEVETPDLFASEYIGTWQFTMSSEPEPLATLEIAAKEVKFNGAAVTAEKHDDGGDISYTFTVQEGGEYSFRLSPDGYAILLTGADATYTMLPEDFDETVDPGFIAAPASIAAGEWVTAGGQTLLVGSGDNAGELFFNSDPIVILTLNEEGTHATALLKADGMASWMEIYFDAGEISVNIAGDETAYTFTKAPEKVEFPNAMWGEWTEYGAASARTLVIERYSVEFNGEDVTASANVDGGTLSFAEGDTNAYDVTVSADERVLFVTDMSGKFALFVSDTAPANLKLTNADNMKGKTFPAGSVTSPLGALAVAADGSVTLGEQAVRILSVEYNDDYNAAIGFTFLYNNMWYSYAEDSGELFLKLTDAQNKTYQFEGVASPDLTEYAGTWQSFYAGGTSVSVTVTIAANEFKYANEPHPYYRALNGMLYYKDIRRIEFGLLAEGILYIQMGGGYLFSATGEMPTGAAFPDSFTGAWLGDTFGRLTITSSGADIRGTKVQPFAVTGEEGKEVVHIIYDNLYWTVHKETAAQGDIIVMDNGTVSYEFPPVAASPLDAEYRGSWKQLGGTDTVEVDQAGKFTYNSTVYETTRDDLNYGFHFTYGGNTATIMVSAADGGLVLWITFGDGTAKYFIKQEFDTLPDISPNLSAGTWTSGDMQFTVEGGKATIKVGAGAAAPVRFLSGEDSSAEEEACYIGTVLYNNIFWDFKYVKSTGVITMTNATKETLTFAPPASASEAAANIAHTGGEAEAIVGKTYASDRAE